jgi:hypothetical protein
MSHLPRVAMIALWLLTGSTAPAQDLQAVNHLWKLTIDAVKRGDTGQARTLFGQFNQAVRSYVSHNGNDWQIEYLVGSLDCQFPDAKASGARILEDVLQDERALNSAGEDELRRQIAACTASPRASSGTSWAGLPQDVADAVAHYQTPGVRGNMKGGFDRDVSEESTQAVSPLPVSELLARRVPLDQPQKALAAALRRLPAGATGGVVQGFAVVIPTPDRARALGIGNCLSRYLPPLHKQFQIEPSDYVVTVYTADSTQEVYDYARTLHGLDLPAGVVAYSVPEDMSLAAVAAPDACGSMAHELVHLLIKRNFPVSPAWLEEGLASEVAVAAPTPTAFKFSYSWRDSILKDYPDLRPKVSDLIEMPWSNFSVSNPFQIHQVAAIQAMAAVFIRYLDAKGKLSATYFAVRDQHLNPDYSSIKSYREILETELGMNISKIDEDFGRWFAGQSDSAADNGSAQQPDAGNNPPDSSGSPCGPAYPTYAANAPANAMNGAGPNAVPCQAASPNAPAEVPKK